MKKILITTVLLINSFFVLAQRPDFAAKKAKFDSLKGQAAPDFEFLNLKGEKIKLSNLKGKTVIINFFFTACAPCVREIPFLNSLVEKYNNENIKFISISRWEDAETLKPFLEKHPIKFDIIPSVFKGEESQMKLFAENIYHVMLYPSLVIIDKEGIIRHTQVGYIPAYEETFLKELDNIILNVQK
jgi:peroxiredoxin